MARGKKVEQALCKAIIAAHENGTSGRAIAKNMGVARSTVRDIVRQYKDTGSTAPKPRHRPPPQVTPRDLRTLRKIILGNRRMTTSKISLEWNLRTEKAASASTCLQYIHALGYDFRKVRLSGVQEEYVLVTRTHAVRCYLAGEEKATADRLQKKKQLRWAMARKDWDQN